MQSLDQGLCLQERISMDWEIMLLKSDHPDICPPSTTGLREVRFPQQLSIYVAHGDIVLDAYETGGGGIAVDKF